MGSLPNLLQQTASHGWLFIPSAILLGALHGLEPGHSKTMMAAFIIAIRGTVKQAVLLGLSAALSHSAVVWALGLGGLYLWRGVDATRIEPYMLVASAVLVSGVAIWMIQRTRHEQKLEAASHVHEHHHGDNSREINTGHGMISLEIFEDGAPPHWRIRFNDHHHWAAHEVMVTTHRPDQTKQTFSFLERSGYLESIEDIPEPHEFIGRVRLSHGNHVHEYEVSFVEGHKHDHLHHEVHGLNIADGEYMDAHERAHANDIRRRFQDQNVTTGQIILFGLTGGLVPCPAAITVLLLCLQLKHIALGVTLVAFFSMGLALTMIMAGVVASLSVKHAQKRWRGFGTLMRRAPYASGVLMLVIAAYMAASGWVGLSGHI